MNVFINIAVIMICYLIGSIQIGIIYTKIHSGIDIREFGSKSSGATNISRTLGSKAGLFVLILDILLMVFVGDLNRLSTKVKIKIWTYN